MHGQCVLGAAATAAPTPCALISGACAPPCACSGELMPYERCIFYTVVLAVVALDRPTLKSKVGGV